MENSHDKDELRTISLPARRIARLGKLGSLTAGVATNMALNRVSDQLAQMRGSAKVR